MAGLMIFFIYDICEVGVWGVNTRPHRPWLLEHKAAVDYSIVD